MKDVSEHAQSRRWQNYSREVFEFRMTFKSPVGHFTL